MKFKTAPFKHQRDEWLRSRSLPTRAIHWEQGTGKTKRPGFISASLRG